MTLKPCKDYVDEWVLVSEEEIGSAICGMLQHHSKLIEGAAGCAIAALLKSPHLVRGKSAVVVCCGGNVATATLRDVLEKHRQG